MEDWISSPRRWTYPRILVNNAGIVAVPCS
jgi:hypothetical protein